MASKEKQNGSKTEVESPRDTRQISTVAIEAVKTIVETLKPYELSDTERLKTFQAMMRDDAVGNAFAANAIFVERAFAKPKVEFDKNDEMSVEAAKFLRYNLANLDGQTMRSIARNAIEFKRDGLSPLEKRFRKEKSGEWEGKYVMDKFSYIPPITLDPVRPFTIVNQGRKISSLRQSLYAFKNSSDYLTRFPNSYGTGYVTIPRNKVTFFTYSATDSQPYGVSPFETAYTAWREKTLIQDYALIGVTKDMAGTPVLYLPEDILAKASEDPSSQAGQMVEQLKTNLANMHAANEAFTILPSNTLNSAGTGSKAYEMKFLGVDGGGKNFDLTAMIEQRKKAIYNCFGAANLITGESGGSYNLIEGQNSIHAFYVERDISVILEGFNKDIIPQLFRLNGWKLTPEQMPKLCAGEIQPVTLSEFGQYVNRVGRFIPAKPDIGNAILERMGIDYRIPDNVTPDEYREMLFTYEEPQKNAQGEGSSGTGDSQDGAQSDQNTENAD